MKIKKSIVVNSLGEVCDESFEGSPVVAGSVSGPDAYDTYDPHLEHERKSISFKEIKRREIAASRKALHAGLHKCRSLTFDDVQWVEYIWDIQELNDGFARIWARDGKIWMSVEFREKLPSEGPEYAKFWKDLYAKCKKHFLKVWTMNEGCIIKVTNVEKIKGGGVKGIIDLNNQPTPPERQVSVDDIVPYKASMRWVRGHKRWLMRLFKNEFKGAGVNVC